MSSSSLANVLGTLLTDAEFPFPYPKETLKSKKSPKASIMRHPIPQSLQTEYTIPLYMEAQEPPTQTSHWKPNMKEQL